jgi:diacylglycerol kinase (ATP)
MGQSKKIRFIYNPNAGIIHPINYIKRLIARYFPRNLCEHDLKLTEGKGHATQLAREGVDEGCDIVVAMGGDGTINETATALINTDAWLGIVPIGSGNGFARCMAIPLNVRRAIKLVTTGNVQIVDVGKSNGKYFFTTAGFGFDAMVGKRFDEGKMRGPVPYYFAGVKEYMTYKQPEFKIYFDGKKIKLKALLVAVANVKQYGHNAIIAPNAKPDDGLLDLCIVRAVKFLPTVFHLPKLFTGQIQKAPYVEHYQSTEFEIIREHPEVYQLDGEVFREKEKHIKISIIPKALKIITGSEHENK